MQRENQIHRKIVAITGNLCSGKSFILELLRQRGYPVFNYDAEVKKLYGDQEVITKVKQHFPEAIKEGKVNTKILGDIVFFNKEKLKNLELILATKLSQKRGEFIKNAEENVVMFFEVPLLFEKKSEDLYDFIILLTVPAATQEKRFKIRKIAIEKAKKIIDNQIKPEQIKNRVDYIIDTDKSLSDINKDIDHIIYIVNGL